MQLFNHLVSAGEQRGWNRKAKRSGGLEVDYQLELLWLLHRKINRLSPLQDLVDICRGATDHVINVGAIREQSPCSRPGTPAACQRHAVLRCEFHKLVETAHSMSRGDHIKRIG